MKSSMKKVVLGTTTVLAAGAVGQTVKAASTNVPIQARISILNPLFANENRQFHWRHPEPIRREESAWR